MTKHVEQMMKRAEGALGRAFRQLDVEGGIAKRLDAEMMKRGGDDNFVELLIIREVVDRIGRICNAAFIADARAAGPLPFPPREPGLWSFPPEHPRRKSTPRSSTRKRKKQ